MSFSAARNIASLCLAIALPSPILAQAGDANALGGTWKMRSLTREVIATGRVSDVLGDKPEDRHLAEPALGR
jgi:hypothetical protein